MTVDIRLTSTHVAIRTEYVFIFLLVAVQFWVYFTFAPNPALPNSGDGWWGWWDQGKYIQSTRALASGKFESSEHWYPLGYSLLAVPFAWIHPREPFIFVNAIGLALYAVAFIKIFRPHLGRVATLGVLFAALLLPVSGQEGRIGSSPVIRQFVVPWNTIPVAVAYLWIVLLLQTMEFRPRTSSLPDLWLGMLAAFVLVTRPIDVAPLFLAGAYYLWVRLRKERPVAHIARAIFGAVVVLGFIFVLMLLIYGGLATPYSQHSANIGVGFGNLLERFYAIFISAKVTWNEPLSVFALQPWLFVLTPLALYWVVLAPRHAFLPISLIVASCLVYVSYNDFAPHNLIRFMLVHYIVWMLPVLAAAGLCGGVLLVRRKRWITFGLIAIVAPFLLASYRIEPRVVEPGNLIVDQNDAMPVYTITFQERRDLDAIDLVGASPKDWTLLTLAQFDFTIDGKPMTVFTDYRAVQVPDGVRIILNRDIRAQTVKLGLSDHVVSPPLTSEGVRPVRFDGQLELRFWRDRRYQPPATPGAS